ncbi:MAG TPA: ABC transporter ATP-binding protein [Terriglobales bacterium]|nr:ABC transporter ATP-binding protein [Terriglobales bacterium]
MSTAGSPMPIQNRDFPVAAVPGRAPSALPATVATTRNLKKSYGNVVALHDLNLELHSGELLALLGPNGAGKTTLVRVLLGVVRPDAGSVSVFGADPYLGQMQIRMGAMLQVGRVPETLKVREHIDLFSSYYPRPLPLDETLEIAGLTEIRNRPYGELSGGQKQRVLFGIAICGNPDLLFLDEPTAGLDVEARRLMWTQIRALIARGKTVLLTTHYLNEADALADRILVLNQGTIIAEGTPAEIKTRAMGKQVRCTSRLTLEEVRQIPGVLSVKHDRSSFELQVNAAEPVVRELLQRDSHLAELEVTNAGLEEAFLALTQNPNADGKEN